MSESKNSEIKALFEAMNEKPVAFHRVYAKITGSITAGLLLSQLVYWSKAMKGKSFYKTDQDLCDELCFGLYELKGAKDKIKEFVEIKRKGVPAKTWYTVDEDKLIDAITSYGKNQQLVMGKTNNKTLEKPITITENKSENKNTIYKNKKLTPQISSDKENKLGPNFQKWENPEDIKERYTEHCKKQGNRIIFNKDGEQKQISPESFSELVFQGMEYFSKINESANTLCYTDVQIKAMEEMLENEKIGLKGIIKAVESIKFFKKGIDYYDAEELSAELEFNFNNCICPNANTPVSIRNEFDKIMTYAEYKDSYMYAKRKKKIQDKAKLEGKILLKNIQLSEFSIEIGSYEIDRLEEIVGMLGSIENVKKLFSSVEKEKINLFTLKEQLAMWKMEGIDIIGQLDEIIKELND